MEAFAYLAAIADDDDDDDDAPFASVQQSQRDRRPTAHRYHKVGEP